MKGPLPAILAALLSIAVTGAAAEPTMLFLERFDYSAGASPSIPPWTTVNSEAHPDHEAVVRQDLGNRFNRGMDNHYLDFRDASGSDGSLRMTAADVFSAEVITLSFLFYEPLDDAYPHQLTVQLFAGSGARTSANRAQVLRLRNGTIPAGSSGSNTSYGENTRRRIDFVVNNSDQIIAYHEEHTLESGLGDIWIDGELTSAGYSFAREAGTGPIRSVDFSVFSNHNQRVFLDDIAVFEGAVVGEPIPEPPPPPPPPPVTFPLILEPNRESSELFGYSPEYTQNVPTFDSRNRPYIRSRGVDHDDTGYVHTLRNGRWVARDFTSAIREAYPEFDAFYRGAGWFAERVVFDSSDRAYTIVTIRLSGGGVRNLLLFSEDYGVTWEVHELSRGGTFAIEHFVGHNEINGPPFLLLSRRRVDPRPDEPWGASHAFHYLQPRIEDKQLIVPSYTLTHINDRLLSLGQHSGGSSFSVTKEDKTHFAWIEVSDDNVSGAPTFVSTYDHATRSMGDAVLVAYAPPVNDSHNRPGIVMDSDGYLHVVTGAHHGQNFYYTRSNQPHDVYSGWSPPVAVWGSGWRAVNGENRGGQTYVSLVCDPDDTLHLVFRHWRYPDEHFSRNGYSYYAGLAYQRKPKGGEWSEPRLLVAPERGNYSVYYQKLAVDHRGRLFLSFSYFDWTLDQQNPDNEQYWRRMVILSDDGGDTWRFAATEDFAAGIFPATFGEWQSKWFRANELAEPDVSSPDVDPDGDGLRNLLEYALGLNPNAPERDSLPKARAAAAYVNGEEDRYLTLQLRMPVDIEDAVYAVRGSVNLAQWEDSPVLVSVEQNHDRTATHTYRTAAPIREAGHQFLRLSVELPGIEASHENQ